MSERTLGRERRLVSVLFGDLAGFTSAAETVDPEEVHAFLSQLMAQLHGIVESFGGTVVNTMGDGFLAVFGAPSAHPDDAERALRAAFAVREAVREFAYGSFPRSDLHAGVHTGWVFVAPGTHGIDVVGDTVNTASRIATIAGPGTILAGDLTRALTASVIRYRELEPVRVKGKVEPLRIFEAVDVRTSADQDFPEPAETPLLGRGNELAQLEQIRRAAWDAGRSAVVIVAGAPGVGKSRLAAEFAGSIHGARVLVGRSVPFGDRIPWLAVTHALRILTGVGEMDSAAVAGMKIADAVGSALSDADADERARVVRNLGLLLGIEDAGGATRGGSGAFNWEIAASVRRFLSATAAAKPIVVVLEDLQWADAEVVSFVRWLHDEPWDARVMVIGLSWDDAVDALGVPTEMVFPLFGLDRTDSDALVGALLAGGELPADVAANLSERAGGNPLFLQEIVRLLTEAETLRLEDGCWMLTERARPEVPETVHLVVAARIDALPAEERRLLRDAAVCGRTFSRAVLDALGWDDGLGDVLASLEERDLIYYRGDEFAFRHVVIRDVAYDSIPRVERAEKHLAVAEWFRTRSDAEGEEPVEMLGYHYGQAAAVGFSVAQKSIAPLAVGYLTRAGDRASAQRAVREAESWYRQALEVEPPEPSTAAGERGKRTLAVLINHAEVLFQLSRYADAREEASRALEMARIADDARFEGESLLQLGRLDSLFGSIGQSRDLLATARARFEEAKDDNGRARVVRALADTWRLDDIAKMVELLEESARMFAAAGDRLNELFVYEDLAYVHTTQAGPDFERWLRRSEELLSHTNDSRSLAVLNRTKGFRAFYVGDFDAAGGPLEQAVLLGKEVGDVFVEMDGRYLLSRVRLHEGNLGTAAEHAHILVRFGSAQKIRRTEEQGLVTLAFVASREGRGDEAMEFLDLGRSLLAGIGAEREMAEVEQAAAHLALESGAWTLAGERARAYQDVCHRYGDSFDLSRARVIEARAHLAVHDYVRASALFTEALGPAREHKQPDVVALATPLCAEALLLGGRSDEAESLLTGLELDQRFPERAAALLEARAILDAVRHDENGARAHIDAAVAAWQRFGLTVWLARAHAIRAALGDPESMKRAREVLTLIGDVSDADALAPQLP
ncbi:MAG: adenylate/guanylate cyclase domain-containing protein [Actinomycetota bacterium]|nr:AAA family ATPase [Actinomycetota bacterium]